MNKEIEESPKKKNHGDPPKLAKKSAQELVSIWKMDKTDNVE